MSSRWNKSRPQSYTLPLDALLKENENTNRPVHAARSAGTVGKWGTTSFTSIRARPIYGFASFSPSQEASFHYPNISPDAANDGPQAADATVVPKPKKFFKSRNSVPDTDVAGIAALAETPVAITALPANASAVATLANVHQQPHSSTSKTSTKSNKKNADGATRKTKAEKAATKAEKAEKVEKPAQPEKKAKVKKRSKAEEKPIKVVPEVKPTRVLSRTRKAVNYSEDKSRSPTPTRQTIAAPVPPPLPLAHSDLETSPIHQPQFNSDGEPFTPIESQAIQHLKVGASPPSSSKTLATDHPPIVLRISKGTSRLVSTDSEGINNSPPYLSPIQQHHLPQLQQTLPNISYTSAAASLVAVLSDESPPPPPQLPNHNEIAEAAVDVELPTPAKSKPKPRKAKAEPIKLKIKTNAKQKNNNETINDQEIVRAKTTRSSRQQRAAAVAAAAAIEETNSIIPEIGTANYELYRTLTAEEREIDVQNLVLDTSLVSPEVKQSNSTLPTAEADAYLAPPHSGTLPNTEETSVETTPKKRGARAKAKPINNTQVPVAVAEEPIPKKIRGRRNQVVEPIPVAEESGRRRITAAAKKHYKELDETPAPAAPPAVEVPAVEEPIETPLPVVEAVNEVLPQKARGRRGKKGIESSVETTAPPPPTRSVRATRHNTNGNMMQENETKLAIPTVTRSYGRKRKQPDLESTLAPIATAVTATANAVADESSLLLPDTESLRQNININLPFVEDETATKCTEARIPRTKIKRLDQNGTNSAAEQANISNNNEKLDDSPFGDSAMDALDDIAADAAQSEVEKPSVKLVISKKKGSIFKSRAIDSDSGDSGKKQKRHVYKHKWDDDLSGEKAATTETETAPACTDDPYADDVDMETPIAAQVGPNAAGVSKLSRQARANVPDDDLRIRNVKKAHQMQEIGEFQEMDDDVEYILESLKSQNPIATRSLAAIQLASKCMTPAFRMHVRAHGTATKFFGALHDATQNQSLGLCTATIMFVLIQDNLNMDLDKHSLELMLNLLDSDISQKNNYKDSGLTDEQSHRNEQKVIEICREIKSQGKAVHLNLENISIGTLAMETLLTLTSKRAGDWFKDELRQLGGLEHIINTICECCKQISDCVVEWTEPLLEKLRKIERCLRVLENVSERNEDNQKYILCYKNGHAVETLVNFYRLCDTEIVLYPTKDATTAANNPGVVLREALVPTLKVLINLTHTFHNKPLGSVLFGEKPVIFDTSLHLLFQAPNYVPEKCIFELSLLVLLLLINLTVHSVPNRASIMEADAPTDFSSKFDKVPAIKALIEYFYKYEEMARFVEQNTDAILDNPEKSEKAKHKSQEEIDETVSTLLQRAGNHMEHTMLASYVCLLVGHLVMDCKKNETSIRKYLRSGTFEHMVQILEKYYNFMNLTASSEAIQVAHMKETKRIIQFMKNSDVHSTTDDEQPKPEQTYSARSTVGTNSKAVDTSTARLNSNTATTSSSSSSSNNMFNRVYFSGR